MKKTIFVFLLAMGAFIANAQNETKTPGTDDKTQTTSPDKSSTNHDANTNTGKTSTSEMSSTKLMISDLPKAVSESLTTQHQGWTTNEVYKIDYEGSPAYKVKVSKGQEKKVLIYDVNGKLLKTKDASHKDSGTSSTGSTPETETK